MDQTNADSADSAATNEDAEAMNASRETARRIGRIIFGQRGDVKTMNDDQRREAWANERRAYQQLGMRIVTALQRSGYEVRKSDAG